MNKIKEALRLGLRSTNKYLDAKFISTKKQKADPVIKIINLGITQFTTLQSSLSKLLGDMDEFDYTYGENIFHISGKARDKFLDIYNKLDLIIQGKEAYKSEEKKE